MIALTWQGKGKVTMSETYKPKIIDDNDVIVKVTGSTICGSDLHLLHGAIVQMQSGDILGHEFMGVVDKIGSRITKVKPGQRVVASFQIACGNCRFCKENLSSTCENTNGSKVMSTMYGQRTAGFFGYSHLTGGFGGGQAEFVRVPLGDVNLLPIPDDVPDEAALYLSDVLCTSYHTVKYTKVEKGDVVAIWGMGPIGIMAAIFAKMDGAARVIGIDSNWRLEWAKSKIPGLETLDYSTLGKKTVKDALLEMVPGGIDVALECAAGEYPKSLLHKIEIATGLETDTSELLNEMITSTRAWGRCGITGVYAGFVNHLNIGSMMQRGVALIGCGQAPCHKYWKELLQMIQERKLDPTLMVTHRFDLADADKAYYAFEKRDPKDGIQKIFLQTRFSGPPAKGTPELTKL
ncbi:GroES-like protein [Atractiella rhizophila]|nr:GroES-like protein [Atractiella rhizophila]